jgi:hypothetical protein
MIDHGLLRFGRPVFVGPHAFAIRPHTLLSSHGRNISDRRVKIVATQVEGEMGVIEAAGGRLLHHHLLHVHVGAGRLATISGEKILPGFGVEIEARESQTRHLRDSPAHRLAIAIKGLEKVSEPDSQHRGLEPSALQTCRRRWRRLAAEGSGWFIGRFGFRHADPRSCSAGRRPCVLLEGRGSSAQTHHEVSLESVFPLPHSRRDCNEPLFSPVGGTRCPVRAALVALG